MTKMTAKISATRSRKVLKFDACAKNPTSVAMSSVILKGKWQRRQHCIYLRLSQKRNFKMAPSHPAPLENMNAVNPSNRFCGEQISQTGFVEYKYRAIFVLVAHVICTLLNAVG